MAYALCDELRSAQPIEFQPKLFWGMFYTRTFQNLGFDIKIELNIFFTFVVVEE